MNAEARWLRDHHLNIVRLTGPWPLYEGKKMVASIPRGLYVAVYSGKWCLTMVYPVERASLPNMTYAHVNYEAFDKVWHTVPEEEAEREFIESAIFDHNWTNAIALRDRLRELYPPKQIELQLQSKKRSHR